MQNLVNELSALLTHNNMMIVTAESCTGGLLAASLTAQPGASEYFERGFVTYSNQAKQEELNVHAQTIQNHGAVSHETALEMAKGALKNSAADISVSVTGIAGPAGGMEDKPVGTVYVGFALKSGYQDVIHNVFEGSRKDIQEQSMAIAFECLIKILRDIK